MNTKEKLKLWHEEYVTRISSRGWAVSIQTSILIFNKLSEMGKIKTADFGSGFSSVILRFFPDNSCFSIDHDKCWLEKTKKFLLSKGMDTTGLTHLDDFMKSNIKDLDFSFYDLGDTKDIRWGEFLHCYERMKEGSIMVLDDLHCKAGYLEFVESSIKKTSKLILRKDTTDEFGRFSGIILV